MLTDQFKLPNLVEAENNFCVKKRRALNVCGDFIFPKLKLKIKLHHSGQFFFLTLQSAVIVTESMKLTELRSRIK